MHPRIQEVLNFFDEQYHSLRAAAEAVPAAHRERGPGEGRWSVAQVMDHVARVNGMAAHLIGGAVAKSRDALPQETETGSILNPAAMGAVTDRSVRRKAPEAAHPAADARYEDACAALDASCQRMRDAFAAADGLAIGTISVPHPALGPLDLYQWGVVAGSHQARHAAQIREAAGELAGTPAAHPGA